MHYRRLGVDGAWEDRCLLASDVDVNFILAGEKSTWHMEEATTVRVELEQLSLTPRNAHTYENTNREFNVDH